MGLLKIFQQNLHIYHRNDSTLLCTIHFIYILVLKDVIGSDVGGRFLLAHPVHFATLYRLYVYLERVSVNGAIFVSCRNIKLYITTIVCFTFSLAHSFFKSSIVIYIFIHHNW